MNKSDLARGIKKVWSYAKTLKLQQEFSIPTELNASEAFKNISVSPSASYEEVYLEGLNGGQYNIMLLDYSYFQFGFGKAEGVRFAYYPNPFIGSSREALGELWELQEYVAEGVMTVEEFLHRISEIRYSQHPPLIRYEYSKTQYVNLIHPCSHLHLGFHAENRWPVGRFLTPDAFALLVLKLFYSDIWEKIGIYKEGEVSISFDDVLAAARQNCRLLAAEEFSDEERRQFHIW